MRHSACVSRPITLRAGASHARRATSAAVARSWAETNAAHGSSVGSHAGAATRRYGASLRTSGARALLRAVTATDLPRLATLGDGQLQHTQAGLVRRGEVRSQETMRVPARPGTGTTPCGRVCGVAVPH